MRLTLRGFKDLDADDILTYAGTSSRLSQKILVSEAVLRGWPIVALDVKKAFLKGVSYAELAKGTGEPERDVNFELDADGAAIRRTIPGFEDFDPAVETLIMYKPIYGLKDAPRAWRKKLHQVLRDFQMQQLHAEPEIYVLHDKADNVRKPERKTIEDVVERARDAEEVAGEGGSTKQWIASTRRKLQMITVGTRRRP